MATEQKKTTQKITPKSIKKSASMINSIKGRQTDELVIALCGPVGSGTSTLASIIAEIFENDYEYKVDTIKVSALIKKHYDLVVEDLKNNIFSYSTYHPSIDYSKKMSELNLENYEKIALLQSAGNILRKIKSPDILAQLAVKEIVLKRAEREEPSSADRTSWRHVTIIDSLKNPEEVELLQLIYNNMFFLFGVLCPEEIREKRLTDSKEISKTNTAQLMERDKSDGEDSGQQMLKTILHSDFFVTNIAEKRDSLKPNLERYVKIMMGDKSLTPLKEEIAMFHAYSASVKSGCLSRQVGASIMDNEGKIISTGCNDVPKPTGGLYTAESGNDDSRCIFKYDGKCQNDLEKEKIFENIKKILNENINSEVLKENINKNELISAIYGNIKKQSKVKNIGEYCRAIHAEMDAITSVAFNGGHALKETSLFCTTFPCHNCAKHIVAAGISKVYYIEPYEKSLAPKLHGDSIAFYRSSSSNDNKTQFLPFEGVGPKKYLKLFYAEERKKDGQRIPFHRKHSKPNIPVLLESRYKYESVIIENLKDNGFVETL